MALRIQRGAANDAATALTDPSVGTVFGRRPNRMSARSLGSHAAESAASLTLDAGAVRAGCGSDAE